MAEVDAVLDDEDVVLRLIQSLVDDAESDIPGAQQKLDLLVHQRCIIDCDCRRTPCVHMKRDAARKLLPVDAQALLFGSLFSDYREPPVRSIMTEQRMTYSEEFRAQVKEEMTITNPRVMVTAYANRAARRDSLFWEEDLIQRLRRDDDDRVGADGCRDSTGHDVRITMLRICGRSGADPLRWIYSDPAYLRAKEHACRTQG